jgi:cytochrome c biogenesis protein CcmG/thiol:disulfide interchange protein DsbE
MWNTSDEHRGRAMRRRALALALLLCLVACASAPSALADGDPGSDVLVYQSLFLASDAGVTIAQQATLDRLLQATRRSGFPVRIAIIASRDDLGSVTALWLKPRLYARFLSVELSLAYTGPLLVVMPNGFGFNWPGHAAPTAYRTLSRIAIRPGGTGLASAVRAAVSALAAAEHVRIAAPSGGANAKSTGPPHGGASAAASVAHGGDGTLIVAAALAAIAAVGIAVLVVRSRRARPEVRLPARGRRPRRLGRAAVPVSVALALSVGLPILALSMPRAPSPGQGNALATNPYVDPGTRVSGPAPGFTLTDELGRPVSLHAFRGKVIILAFTDSECTTICPLTTSAMLAAKRMLGAAGSQVQLLGVDANPKATALQDVLSYSQLHGLLGDWHFLTGSLLQLKRVWGAYHIEAAIEAGQVAHTPAVYVVDPRGRLARIYSTQQSYASIDQQAQVFAGEASALLPGHPPVRSSLTYAQIPTLTPADRVSLARAGGGTVRLGPARSPRLLLFFATWNQQTTSLGGQLETLDRYASSAHAARLPALTAVDEGSVEPSTAALGRFLDGLPRPLSYPVAIDRSGRVADGYEVQGEPWFVLTSPNGRILWYWEVSTSGWPSQAGLARDVRAALAPAPRRPADLAAAQRELAGSPAPLAALHQQADRLLGTGQAFSARIRALRGYPIVVNAWASWCIACQSEFDLFATASAHYGRDVAFLGADTGDYSAGDARAFLAAHPVTYPSFQTTTTDLNPLAPIPGLPTTIFINRAGRVVDVHVGVYDSQGSLDGDVETYALGG